ncbi:MAG TPA: DUF2135 domain-containing protein [Caldithrix abyssi]|uniref:DUF2135 domain-containing protein n=1 Tax=Caldithrix abyssi TaxID=187145 RepID=A0A7V5H4X2_CALAY|nr:DUF2135 domain-containing protein [Caldithrix abyssi]
MILLQMFFALFVVAFASAQMMPQLVIVHQMNKNLKPLQLSKLKIDIKVTGNLATTTMDITYFNPNNRQLEGKFYLPLNRRQTVSRFALEVNGYLREGVVVEKARATQIFEDVERRQIDPGLLEMVSGNNFKARIYPIPPNGFKRLVIASEQELEQTERGYLYRLPLQFEQKVSDFSIHVEVFKQKIKPLLFQSELNQIEFKNWHELYLADFVQKDYLANRSLSFVLPQSETSRQFVYSCPTDGLDYFYLTLTPKIKTELKKLPENIVLFWDVSSSAEKRDLQKELKILDGYFQKIKDARLKIVTFNFQILEEKEFVIKDGSWQNAKQYLLKLQYDGGTQLGALDFSRYQADEFILCSDGLSNIGSDKPKLGSRPIVVINSSPNANHVFLQQLASQSRGRYFDLNTLTIDQARQLLLQKPFLFMKARVVKGKVKELLPAQVREMTNQFSVAGQLVSEQVVINLQFGDGKHVLFNKRITIDKSKDLIDDPIVRRIWAQKKLNELSVNFSENEEKFVQLAKDYGIVTPKTSLLVLDRIEDYVRYKVIPPEKELREQYFVRVQQQEKTEEQQTKSHLEEVVKMFNNRCLWWQDSKFRKQKWIEQESVEVEDSSMPESRGDVDRILQAFTREERLRALPEGQPSRAVRAGARALIGSNGEMDALAVLTSGAEAPARPVGPNMAKIKIKKWDLQTPYLKALKKCLPGRQFETYMTFKQGYANSPAFYFDVADFFADQGKTELALQVSTNLAELELENHELLRMLAYRLIQMQQYKLAISMLQKVVKLRPFEPQSYRDLAMALEQTGQYQKAVDLLYKVVTTPWDQRFPEIELIALEEMNNIIALHGQRLNLKDIDKRLIKNLPLDLRIVMTWDADNTDIDLWVIDPNNEKCYYQNRYTKIGGYLSKDFTGGYGPEEFLLKKAPRGSYKIKANFYGDHRQILSSSVTVFVDIFTHYGTKQQKKKSMHLRLKNVEDLQDIATVEIQ